MNGWSKVEVGQYETGKAELGKMIKHILEWFLKYSETSVELIWDNIMILDIFSHSLQIFASNFNEGSDWLSVGDEIYHLF